MAFTLIRPLRPQKNGLRERGRATSHRLAAAEIACGSMGNNEIGAGKSALV